MKNFVFTVRIGALAIAAQAAFPAGGQTLTATPTLQETVVTATRISQPVTDIVADVTIIDAQAIDQSGATSISQLLTGMAGLQAIGHGDSSRIYMRGADARMTALYLDGIRIDSQDGVSALGGGVPWELVPLSQIDRIEILRGPASAVYGSDAMGGVIQIFTKSGEGPAAPYVQTLLGSHRTQQVKAGVSGGQNQWSYALGVAFEDTAGYNTQPGVAHLPDREAERQRAASIKLGYAFTQAQKLEVFTLNSERDFRYVPYGGGTDYVARGTLSASAITWASDWNEQHSSRIVVSQSKVFKKDDVPFEYETVKSGLLIENVFRNVAGGNVSAVFERQADSFDSKASGFGDPAFTGSRGQNALALGYGVVNGPHAIQVNLRADQDSLFGSKETGALAYAYSLAPHWRARASVGTAFRSPTLEQVSGPYGSERLKPEANHNSEIGVQFADSESAAQLTVYRNAIKDMISSSASLTSCSAGFFCYYNVGSALIKGITLSGSRRLAGLDVKLALDVLDPRDEVTGHLLSLRARRVLSAGVKGQVDEWQWGANLVGVGQRSDNAANTVFLSGYGVINLTASRSLGRDWSLQARVDNLANRKYEEVGTYATPGRTVQIGLKWQPQH